MKGQTLLKYALRWSPAILTAIISLNSIAAEPVQAAKSSPAREPAAMRSAITYKPPLSDLPQSEAGGSNRGTDQEVAVLQVLAPDHAGLTTQAQPALYWYQRAPGAVRFEFKRADKGETDTLLKVEFDRKGGGGIQRLDLGDHNISLHPGVLYQWSVMLVRDEKSGSKQALAVGEIERVEPGEGLTSRIKGSHGTDLVDVYASEGIWYDALDTISSMIEKSPQARGLVSTRAALLEQVGLHAAAGSQ